mgnify:CR=1 FL=1
MKSLISPKLNLSWFKLPVIILLSLIVGFLLGGGIGDKHNHVIDIETSKDTAVEVWTCSMHPQIRQPAPGQCPICGMDLIPVSSKSSDSGISPRELTLSPQAAKLAELQVSPVEKKFVTKEIRMVGKVDYDESRLGTITSWIPGRIDRLYVDYTLSLIHI